jgi:hypothetical protein
MIFREFTDAQGRRWREENGQMRIRRGWVWYDEAAYRERFGECENELRAEVIQFRRPKP